MSAQLPLKNEFSISIPVGSMKGGQEKGYN